MIEITEKIARDESPLEKINLWVCYLLIFLVLYIPISFLKGLTEYMIGLFVVLFAFYRYLKIKKINLKFIFGSPQINFYRLLGYLILFIVFNLTFTMATYYVLSYPIPDTILEYLSNIDMTLRTPRNFLNIVIITPILEEIFFRGILINKIKGSTVKKRLFFSSFIFGLGHLEWFFLMTILGFILGYLYLKTNSLYGVIFIHIMNNFIIFFLRATEASAIQSIEQIREETIYGVLGFIIVVPFLINFLATSWKDIKNFNKVPYEKNKLKEETNERINRERDVRS